MLETLPLGKITADTSMQARVGINVETVDEYTDAIKGGASFPPLVIFSDGTSNWLADGWHRLQALKNIGRKATECEIHQGTREDAVLHAVRANDQHGLRRTNADKRRSVELLLTLPSWREKSAEQIADQCGVSRPFADSVKKSALNQQDGQPETVTGSSVGKDGKRRRRPRRPRGTGTSRSKDQEKATLAPIKEAFKTLGKLNGAEVAAKFDRKKLGPNFENAVLFMNALCAAFDMPAAELTGVTDAPAGLNAEAWGAWEQYRKEAKLKAYQPRSRKKNMEWLAQHPVRKQQEIVDLSIRNGYQGLFDAKGSRGSQASTRHADSTDKLRDWAEAGSA